MLKPARRNTALGASRDGLLALGARVSTHRGFARPRLSTKLVHAQQVHKLEARARTIAGIAGSFLVQADRPHASIGGFVDGVFGWTSHQAAATASVGGDGKLGASDASLRVPNPGAAPVMAADNGFAGAVSAKAMRGYDAAQKEGLAPWAQFDPITVMNKTWAPKRPQAGGGNTGHEP